MKINPKCDRSDCPKEFADALNFCQLCGSTLIAASAAEETVDPFKTMVASKEDIAAAMSSLTASPTAEPEEAEEQVLEIPEPFDSGKTQVVSEAELRAEMEKADAANEEVIEVPPVASTPSVPEPEAPKFVEQAGVSEFDTPPPDQFAQSSPAIPSPFGEVGDPSPPVYSDTSEPEQPEPQFSPSDEPSTPFSEPEPPSPFSVPESTSTTSEPSPQFSEPASAYNPFEHSAPMAADPLAKAQMTPSAAQETNMQNPQNIGQTPAPSAGGSVNQTLPIISLVFGILSLCCYISPLTGLIALITGFMGMKNVGRDPNQYGGKTLAIVGMILGGLFFFIGLAYWVFLLFFGGLSMMMNMANQY